MVDCSKGGDRALMTKYGVRGYPTVVFTDSKGKQLEKLSRRDANSVKAQIGRIVEKYAAAPEKEIHDSIGEAATAAKEKKTLVALVFTDSESKSKSTAKKIKLLWASIKSDDMSEVKTKFTWVLRPLKADKKKTDEAKEYKASSNATIVIIDPNGEGKKRILKKMTFSSAKSLKKNLEKILKKHAG
jgi:hypothetical protein